MPAPKKKAMPAAKASGKAFKAEAPRKSKDGKVYTSGTQFQNRNEKPDAQLIKAGATIAKQNRTLSGSKPGVRTSGADSKSLNAGYISGKQDIAAFKRNQAKQAMKKMGKKK